MAEVLALSTRCSARAHAVLAAGRASPGRFSTDIAPTGKPTHASQEKTALSRIKLFVLDTNVLMHDPSCLFRFAEHDVFLPMITLEELDGQKRHVGSGAQRPSGQPFSG